MADQVIAASLVLDANDGKKSMKEFRTALKEASGDLQAMVEKFGLTSKEAREAAKRVAELKDQMGDTKSLTDAFNPDRKFAAFGIAVKGVTNGFTALQGVMALVGSKSEDLQKTLLKVQGALALSEGVNGLLELKDGFKVVQNVAVNAFQKIKTAIGSTGIGLIVLAIGALVAYWDDIKEAVTGVNGELREQADRTHEIAEVERKKLKDIDAQDNILKLQGKTEKEILHSKIKQTEQAIQKTEIELTAAKENLKAQLQAERKNKEILKGILDFSGAGINIILKGIDWVGKVFGKNFGLSGKLNDWITKQVFNPEETEKKGKEELKKIDDTLLELKNKKAGFQLSVIDIDKKAGETRDAEAEKRREEENKKEEEWVKEQLDRLEKRHKKELDIEVQAIVDKREAMAEAEKAADEKIKAQQEAASKINTSNSGVRGTSKEDQEILRSLLLEESDIKLAALDAEYKRRFELVKGNEDAELALRNWYLQQKIDIDHAELESKVNLVDAIGGAIGALGGIFKKESAAAKTAALVEIAVGTGTGFIRALEIAQKSAKATGPGAAFAFPIFYASQIAAVLGAAGRAKAILSSGGSGGGGGGVSAVTPSAPLLPQLNPVQTNTSLDQNSLNQLGNATVRAFVVEADVSGNQERISRLNRSARLGG